MKEYHENLKTVAIPVHRRSQPDWLWLNLNVTSTTTCPTWIYAMAGCATTFWHGLPVVNPSGRSSIEDLAEGQPPGATVQAAPWICPHLQTFVLGERGHHGCNRRLAWQCYQAGWSRRKPDGEGLQPECILCFAGWPRSTFWQRRFCHGERCPKPSISKGLPIHLLCWVARNGRSCRCRHFLPWSLCQLPGLSYESATCPGCYLRNPSGFGDWCQRCLRQGNVGHTDVWSSEIPGIYSGIFARCSGTTQHHVEMDGHVDHAPNFEERTLERGLQPGLREAEDEQVLYESCCWRLADEPERRTFGWKVTNFSVLGSIECKPRLAPQTRCGDQCS